MSSDRQYLEELTGTVMPIRRRHDFNAAVAQLEQAGISSKAADTLIYRAYDRGENLANWAAYLIKVKRDGAKAWS